MTVIAGKLIHLQKGQKQRLAAKTANAEEILLCVIVGGNIDETQTNGQQLASFVVTMRETKGNEPHQHILDERLDQRNALVRGVLNFAVYDRFDAVHR